MVLGSACQCSGSNPVPFSGGDEGCGASCRPDAGENIVSGSISLSVGLRRRFDSFEGLGKTKVSP